MVQKSILMWLSSSKSARIEPEIKSEFAQKSKPRRSSQLLEPTHLPQLPTDLFKPPISTKTAVNELSSITEEEQPLNNMIDDKCLLDFFINLSEDEILEVHRKLKSKIDVEETNPEIIEESQDPQFSEVEVALSKVSSVQQKIVKSQVDGQEYEKSKTKKDTKRHSLAPNMTIPLNMFQQQVRLYDQASDYQRMQSSSNSESEQISTFNKQLKKQKKRKKVKRIPAKTDSFSKIGSLNSQINLKNGNQMVVTLNTFDETKNQDTKKILTFSSNKKSLRKQTMSDLTDEESDSSDEDSELETPISKAKRFANKEIIRQSLTSVSEFISNKHDISCEEDSLVDDSKKDDNFAEDEASSSESHSQNDQHQRDAIETDKLLIPTSDEKVDDLGELKNIVGKNQESTGKILSQIEPQEIEISDK